MTRQDNEGHIKGQRYALDKKSGLGIKYIKCNTGKPEWCLETYYTRSMLLNHNKENCPQTTEMKINAA